MQNTSSFRVTIPLGSVADARTCGTKAFTVDRLVRRGFAVPEGFCVRTDAYRAHLWASGERAMALISPDAAQRETLRRAIADTLLPAEMLAEMQAAYDALGDDAIVAVRHSASDEAIAGSAYETVLGVKGFPALVEAVKSVWASLWSDAAASLRALSSERTEPTMGVLVQVMVDARSSGVVATANLSTGNPNEVVVNSTWGIRTGVGRADSTIIDLSDFRITTTRVAYKDSIVSLGPDGVEKKPTQPELTEAPSISSEQAIELAEAALWIEEDLAEPHESSKRQIATWACDGDRFLILGAKPAQPLPGHFPVIWQDGSEEMFFWWLICRDPVPALAQDLAEVSGGVPALPSDGKTAPARCWNGRVFRRLSGIEKKAGKLAACRDALAGMGLHRKWVSALDRIVEGSRRDIGRPESDHPSVVLRGVQRSLRRTMFSAKWKESVLYASLRFTALLRAALVSTGSEASVLPRLVMGCDVARFERDAAFQRLAAYVWQAESDDEENSSVEQMASRLGKSLGYTFQSTRDACSPSMWRSWAEDPSQIVRIASGLAQGPNFDVELSIEAAYERAEAAEQAALRAVRMSRSIIHAPFARIKLRMLLRRTRAWFAAVSRHHQAHALSLSALRIDLLRLGRLLQRMDALSIPEDVFHLRAVEILELRPKMDEAERTTIRRKVLQRKHEMWMRKRLTPPEWLPVGSRPQSEPDTQSQARLLMGVPASPGEVVGDARVVGSIEDAAAIRPGEVMVVDVLVPAWTPLLGLASGVVIAREDTLLHEQIACRDYGIPCVAGVTRAMSEICTGFTIRVDGTAGQVEIVKRRGVRPQS